MAQARTTPRRGDGHEARIGSTTRVRGRIHGEGDLVIEGQVEGEVALRGNLTIAEGGAVTAREAVKAAAVTVAGSLQGDVVATGQVRIASGARVRGNLRGSGVSIDEGAHFAGKLDFAFDLPPELGGPSRGEAPSRAAAARR